MTRLKETAQWVIGIVILIVIVLSLPPLNAPTGDSVDTVRMEEARPPDLDYRDSAAYRADAEEAHIRAIVRQELGR